MIKVHHLQNFAFPKAHAEPELLQGDYTAAEVAKDGAKSFWCNGKEIDRGKWGSYRLEDGQEYAFVYTHGDPSVLNVGLDLLFTEALTGAVQFSLGGDFTLNPLEQLQQLPKLLIGQLPNLPQLSGGQQSSALGGQRPVTTSQEGAVVPIVYGEFQTAGYYLQRHTYAKGGELYFQFIWAASHGPIERWGGVNASTTYSTEQDNRGKGSLPEDLLFNDTPADRLDDIDLSFRMGRKDELEPDGWGANIRDYSIENVRLNKGVEYEWATRFPVERVKFLLAFPGGLRSLDLKEQEVARFRVTFKVSIFEQNADGSRGSLVDDRNYNVASDSTGIYYKTIEYGGLELRKYVVQIERTGISSGGNRDQEDNEIRRVYNCDLIAITEMDFNETVYRGIATLWCKVKASEQLRGFPNVRAVIRGKRLYDPRVTPLTITGTTNATPIVVTTSVAHGMTSGDQVTIKDVAGNTAANGEWFITSTGANTFELDGSVGNGTYTSGGSLYIWEWSKNNALVIRDIATSSIYGGGRNVKPSDISDTTLTTAADFCDASIPEYTGSGTSEARYECNVAIDTNYQLWPLLVTLASNARMDLIRVGDSVSFNLREAKATTQLFGLANCTNPPSFQGIGTSAIPDDIEIEYLDDDRWQKDYVTSNPEGTDQASNNIQRVFKLGCTRRTEAARHALFLRRLAKLPTRAASVNTGIEGIVAELGNVVEIPKIFGRVESSTSGSRTLDREVTFEAGRVYVYQERNDSATVVDVTIAPGAGTTNTITATGLPAGDATGRIFSIRERGSDPLLFEVATKNYNGDFNQDIVLRQYLGTDIYNDDSSINPTGIYVPTPPSPPSDVASVVVNSETYLRDGFSTLNITWSAVTGAVSYFVYTRSISLNDLFVLNERFDTSSTTRNIIVGARFGERIEIAVGAILDQGVTLDPDTIAASGRVQWNIDRDDEADAFIDFPEDVTGLGISGSGLDRTLSWTAPASGPTPDGYECRLGVWHQGFVVGTTASTSLPVKMNNFVQGYEVRSYTDTNGIRHYSPNVIRVASPEVLPSGYAGSEFSSERFGVSGERVENGVLVKYVEGQFGIAYRMIEPKTVFVYNSPILDAGLTTSNFCSVDVKCSSYPLGTNVFMSSNHIAWTGILNKDYLDVNIFIQSGIALDANGDIDDPTVTDVTDKQQSEIYITGRYYRLVVETIVLDNADNSLGNVLALLERAAIKINAQS